MTTTMRTKGMELDRSFTAEPFSWARGARLSHVQLLDMERCAENAPAGLIEILCSRIRSALATMTHEDIEHAQALLLKLQRLAEEQVVPYARRPPASR
jgi:hypothetical protein